MHSSYDPDTNKEKNTADPVRTPSGPDPKASAIRPKKRLAHWQRISIYLIIYDIIAVNLAYFLGLLLRFDFRYTLIPDVYLFSFAGFAPIYTVATILIFKALHLYRSIWRFASYSELGRLLAGAGLTTLVQIFGITLLFERMPLSYYTFGALIQIILTVGVRFAYRYVSLERTRRDNAARNTERAMVIGAGEAGQIVIRDLKKSDHSQARPVCIIDDNPNKWNRYMEGVPIVGGRDQIPDAVRKYGVTQILLAIPTASAKNKKEILEICTQTGCTLKSLPGVYQLMNGEVSIRKMRPVSMEDLLGREKIEVNADEIYEVLQGKTILVTGGGGSIGSELCRQIAEHEPKLLLILDIYENNAYLIERELRHRYPDLSLKVLIGSVRDSRRLDQIFALYRPDIVYHAAAHKHVPLMEGSPQEAVKNNVIGTYKTAYAALKYGTKRFILISTDKAVNPTSIMGASKRICEMIIQFMDTVSRTKRYDLLPILHAHVSRQDGGTISSYQPASETGSLFEAHARDAAAAGVSSSVLGGVAAAGVRDSVIRSTAEAGIREHMPDAVLRDHITPRNIYTPPKVESTREEFGSRTQFAAVRFGNVLGSNGSVIPLFQKQIEEGGPVTVTHPEITRYFMTISEAVNLVLQAGTYAWGGEIFVLDMGEPVKIDTLARNLIRLSGFVPDEDIQIEYVGLRPGEKLYEEKLMAEEGMKKTDNELIHIGKPIDFDVVAFSRQLTGLAMSGYENAPDIKEIVAEMIPTYHPDRGAQE